MDPEKVTATLASGDKRFGMSEDLQSKGEMMEKSICIEVWGSHSGL